MCVWSVKRVVVTNKNADKEQLTIELELTFPGVNARARESHSIRLPATDGSHLLIPIYHLPFIA